MKEETKTNRRTLLDSLKENRIIVTGGNMGFMLDKDDLTESDYMRRQLALEAARRILGSIEVSEEKKDEGICFCRSKIDEFIRRNGRTFVKLRKELGCDDMNAWDFAYGILENMLNGCARTFVYDAVFAGMRESGG